MNITNTYAILVIDPVTTAKQYEINHEEGYIPAITVEYNDGDKHLVIIPDAPVFPFENRQIIFNIKEFMWNDKFNRWDRTNSGKFNRALSIIETFKVRVPDGKWEEELTEEERELATLVGEYTFWLENLGKAVIIPQLFNSVHKKLQPVQVIEDEDDI